jgi:hypothetical protein
VTRHHDHPRAITRATPAAGTPGIGGRVHVGSQPVDTGPPTRSKITAGLAALACAACCALPLLIAAGLLTTASAAVAEKGLLATSGLLIAAAATLWWLHRRRAARPAATGEGGCAGGTCAC